MMKGKVEKRVMVVLLGLALILLPSLGYSEIPQQINYQGYLTNAAGVPVNGAVEMVFSFYLADTGGSPIWHETQNVAVNKGVYNVNLGDVTPISLPFGLPYYLGVQVGTDPEMTPRQPMTTVGYAYRANVTNSVVGTGTFSNPIVSTVATGMAPLQVLSTTAVAHLNADMLDGNHASGFAPAAHGHDDRYYTKTFVDALEARIAALEAKLNGLTRVNDDFVITGANLHVQSGSGATNGTVNGKGNLIIGYNELRGYDNNREGSHNLIVGHQHSYSSYGGVVVGWWNTISGVYSSVYGGTNNTASGSGSSISGGSGNIASGSATSVSGGYQNTATNNYTSVSGGTHNTASGSYASVSGGDSNTASGQYASVSGGRYNTASGVYSSVTGGGSDNAAYGNKAFGDYTAILGGKGNKTGDPALSDHTIGQYATVSGGILNTASGTYASVSGGDGNTASGNSSSVSAGILNTASGYISSVSGGDSNTASAWGSSVSGGQHNNPGGFFTSVSGGTYNTPSGSYASVSGGDSNTASGWWSSVSGGQHNNSGGLYSSVSGGNTRSVTGDYDWGAGGLFQDQ